MRGLLAFGSLVLAFAATVEQPEVLWEQGFDVEALPKEAWTFEGAAALEGGALHTVSAPDGGPHSQATCALPIPIPAGSDGYLLRLEWTLMPVRIGGWGQDLRVVSGPCVVEFTGERPTLNAQRPARDLVKAGEKAELSCDFNRHQVFSWKINGKEQLEAPVPAWKQGADTVSVAFADFKDTKSETRWLRARLSKVVPEDTLPLHLSGWEELPPIEAGAPSAFLLGVASPMDKVFREAADYRGRFEKHARIAAAGREQESFQIVCMPLGGSLRNVTVEVTDLLHTGGKQRLAAEHITWHPVGYIQTKASNSAIRRAGWWWPDVLLPAKPFDVEAGFVQPIWFTVDVPDGTAPGVYRGFVSVMPKGQPAQSIGVELTVRPFSLPLRGILKTAFCICPGMWEIWYQPDEVKRRLGMTDETGHGPLYTSYECEDVLPKAKWRAIYDFLLAHRLNPTVIYSGLKNGRTRTAPTREDMEYCYERGMNATCLANVDVLPGDATAADQRMGELEAWLRGWEGFVKEKNWPDFTWYVHGFDESEMRPNPEQNVDPSIRRVCDMLGETFPWLKRETANPYVAKHEGRFDIWTPVTSQLDGDLGAYRTRQEAGDEVWAYVCCGPGKPFANLFIDFPGVDPRILGWQFFQYKLTGFLYYLVNYYEPQENWNMAAPKWPDRPWNPLSFRTNSDGILIYPGPDATPLASTRLENLRDGIEDYEALALLRRLADRLSAQKGFEDLAGKAREVVAVREAVSASWTEYTQDPSRIVEARAEVDEVIEAVMRALGVL